MSTILKALRRLEEEKRSQQPASLEEDVLLAAREGRSPLVLTERTYHLQRLAELLDGKVKNIVILQGGMGKKQRIEVAKNLDDIEVNKERVIIATGQYIGEGFDDARLDTLFLTLPP